MRRRRDVPTKRRARRVTKKVGENSSVEIVTAIFELSFPCISRKCVEEGELRTEAPVSWKGGFKECGWAVVLLWL